MSRLPAATWCNSGFQRCVRALNERHGRLPALAQLSAQPSDQLQTTGAAPDYNDVEVQSPPHWLLSPSRCWSFRSTWASCAIARISGCGRGQIIDPPQAGQPSGVNAP